MAGKEIKMLLDECPRCGGKQFTMETVEAVKRKGVFSTFYSVSCPCGTCGPIEDTEFKALAKWQDFAPTDEKKRIEFHAEEISKRIPKEKQMGSYEKALKKLISSEEKEIENKELCAAMNKIIDTFYPNDLPEKSWNLGDGLKHDFLETQCRYQETDPNLPQIKSPIKDLPPIAEFDHSYIHREMTQNERNELKERIKGARNAMITQKHTDVLRYEV